MPGADTQERLGRWLFVQPEDCGDTPPQVWEQLRTRAQVAPGRGRQGEGLHELPGPSTGWPSPRSSP